jgi:hypothetical protein
MWYLSILYFSQDQYLSSKGLGIPILIETLDICLFQWLLTNSKHLINFKSYLSTFISYIF